MYRLYSERYSKKWYPFCPSLRPVSKLGHWNGGRGLGAGGEKSPVQIKVSPHYFAQTLKLYSYTSKRVLLLRI